MRPEAADHTGQRFFIARDEPREKLAKSMIAGGLSVGLPFTQHALVNHA